MPESSLYRRAVQALLAALVLSTSFGCALTRSLIPGTEEETLTTSVNDAPKDQLAPDALKLPEPEALTYQPAGEDGAFLLDRGGLYETELKTFCLHAGKARGGKGTAYLPAPLKGPRASAVRSVLRAWGKHPEFTQGEVQSLIWGILAQGKISENPNLLKAAKVFLSAKEISELDGGALGILPKDTLDQLTSRLPPEAKKVMEAQNALREKFADAQTSYEELEKIAAPEAADPGPAKGTWTRMPQGYLIRYFPQGYQSAKVQIFVPSVEKTARVPLVPGAQYAQAPAADGPVSVDVSENVAAPNNETAQRLGAAPPAPEPPRKMANNELLRGPDKRGNAPIGKDNHPVELHHRGQKPDSPLDEMTRTEHRGKGNFSKNHSNTGQEPSKIDRDAWKNEQKNYWKKEWDGGRFEGL